jgi:hypothetical protein
VSASSGERSAVQAQRDQIGRELHDIVVLTAMPRSTSAELAFCSIFRQEAAIAVEYSYGVRPDEHGVMVRGGADFPSQVESLAASLPFAGKWISVLVRLIRAIRPDAYLLRTDWSSTWVTAVTAYCRFPAEPDEPVWRRCCRTLTRCAGRVPPPGG